MEKESNNTNVEVVEKKKTFSWIIIVFLLLVIAGILFYFMYYKPKMDQKPVLTPAPTQTEVDEPTDPEDPGIYDPDEPMEDVDIESTDVKDSKDNIIGVIKESDYKKATYYSNKAGKIIYGEEEVNGGRYGDFNLLTDEYLAGNVYKCKTVTANEEEEEDYEDCVQTSIDILSPNENKLIKRIEITDEIDQYVYKYEEYGFILILADDGGGTCMGIYTMDLKLVDDCGKDGIESFYYYINENKASVAKNGVIKTYDTKGNLIKTSKKYDGLQLLVEDYKVLINNNKIKLVTPDEKEIVMGSWNSKKMVFHKGLSGMYETNNKNGVYLVFADKDVTVDQAWNYCKNHKEECGELTKEEVKYEDRGYELYYIPKTGETGKIYTVIGGYAKPVLYLYPKTKTNVTVTFDKPSNLTTTYPKYNNSWKVTAYPNGDLYDKDNKYYYALYWEEVKNHEVTFDEGFYVNKDNAIEFLEEKLTTLGFNPKERNEFIMYWLPILERNEHNLVYFEQTEERDKYSKINISPKPDSILRISMHIKKVDGKVSIKEQKLNTFNRTGFSVVEWGGVIH